MILYYHDSFINFEIICCKGSWLDSSLNITQKSADGHSGNGNAQNLVNLGVKCPDSHRALIGFKLIRTSPSLVAHQYTCAKAKFHKSYSYTEWGCYYRDYYHNMEVCCIKQINCSYITISLTKNFYHVSSVHRSI